MLLPGVAPSTRWISNPAPPINGLGSGSPPCSDQSPRDRKSCDTPIRRRCTLSSGLLPGCGDSNSSKHRFYWDGHRSFALLPVYNIQ
ncbi:uncharacterized protein V6R79_011374, partial [Siganus canaliculatus]